MEITTHNDQGENKQKKEYKLSKDGKTLTVKIKTYREMFETEQTRVYDRQQDRSRIKTWRAACALNHRHILESLSSRYITRTEIRAYFPNLG